MWICSFIPGTGISLSFSEWIPFQLSILTLQFLLQRQLADCPLCSPSRNTQLNYITWTPLTQYDCNLSNGMCIEVLHATFQDAYKDLLLILHQSPFSWMQIMTMHLGWWSKRMAGGLATRMTNLNTCSRYIYILNFLFISNSKSGISIIAV